MKSRRTFLEFFAGGGMARAGLGDDWNCLFANDIDRKKAAAYEKNWGGEELLVKDIAKLSLEDLPRESVDMAWASFPCQDLSLAGSGAGLGGERSGTFWPFCDLISSLSNDGAAPSLVVLENVRGTITSHGGKDFIAIAEALADRGYNFGALVIDAIRFLPQSRPRLFVIASRQDIELPDEVVAQQPIKDWHTDALVRVVEQLPQAARERWVWWNLPSPEPSSQTLVDLIEDEPLGVDWNSKELTDYLLSLMSPVNLKKVKDAQKTKERTVGTVYRRTRKDASGKKVQRAEVRFDGVAGCLRTPAGGSSRQTILVVEGRKIRSRLLSPREAARLMGLQDSYVLPEKYNEAYHLAGDGLVVPAVNHLAVSLLQPILEARDSQSRAAA